MKELIVALRACLAVANNEGQLDADQYDLVSEHINSLEDLTIRNGAIEHLKLFMHNATRIPHDTASGALAKMCAMLVPYGSKTRAILAVIHDKGWPVVTLDDVNAVRAFILEQ